MSTLDIKSLKKQAKVYLLISGICLIFGTIYEMFSHEVYSKYMIFAFAIPLILGAGVSLAIYLMNKKNANVLPSRTINNLYNAAIATFTVGSIVNGILEIYGTTNEKVYVYLGVGAAFLICSLIGYAIRIIRN